MLWLVVILFVAGLSFVLFHKPPLNAVGAGWQPPRFDPPPLAEALASGLAANPESGLAASPESGLAASPELGLAASPESGLAATPEPGTSTTGGGHAEDAITLRMDRSPADAGEWSAEDAVTAPMARPAGRAVVDGATGQNAQPLA